LHLLVQTLDLLGEPDRLPARDRSLLAIGGVHRGHVAGDALLDLRDAGPQLGRREVLVAAVDRLELAAVDGDQSVREQAHAAAEKDEAPAGRLDRCAIVAAEVGNRLEVGSQVAEQPDQLEVSLRLALQAPAGGNAVQVAVDVELQQCAWMVGRTPRLCRGSPLEPELGQVQPVDARLDDTNGVVLVDVVVDALRQQQSLTPVRALDIARHDRESVAAPPP